MVAQFNEPTIILEGIVTTTNPDGSTHIAAMGPRLLAANPFAINTFELRPFKTALTFRNLQSCPEGVLHFTDDVLLLAQASLGIARPEFIASKLVTTPRLADCCRFHEFRVESHDIESNRATLLARVLHTGFVRHFAGLNRAMYAVVEAAILVSRMHILERSELVDSLTRLQPLVEKTGGPREREAFALLREKLDHEPQPP